MQTPLIRRVELGVHRHRVARFDGVRSIGARPTDTVTGPVIPDSGRHAVEMSPR